MSGTLVTVGAVAPGWYVWGALGAAVVVWVVVTLAAGPARLPGPATVARWFLRCWLGRALLLGGWAVAGWHLFCQRP